MPDGFSPHDVTAEFRDAFASAGLVAPAEVVANGRWNPCSAAGRRQPNDAGRYKLYTDGLPTGLLHNWRTGESATWHPNRTSRKFTKAEREDAKRRIAEANEQREATRATLQEKVATGAETVLANWPDCTTANAYLTRKQVGAYGLKAHPLVIDVCYVPMRDIDGKLWALQKIFADGTKDFAFGSRKTGCFHTIDKLVDGEPIQIAEGYATAASCYESNGVTSIVAFDAGNLIHVAKAIRERYRNSPITLLADDDTATARRLGIENPGIKAGTAAALAVGGKLAVPQFGPGWDDEKETDFNDLAAARGLGEVREQIAAARKPERPQPTYPAPADTCTLLEARAKVAQFVDEFVGEVLKPKKPTDFNRPSVIAINAPPGIGKTYAMLQRIVDLLNAGKKVIIVVPTHMLGEQLVRDLNAAGVPDSRVWRSRRAADPLIPGNGMCWKDDLVKSIVNALGDEEQHACKSGDNVCPLYDQCGYQRQKRNPPRVWIVAHQYLYRKLPSAIRKSGEPDVVIIDEAFHDAGNEPDLKFHISWLIDNREDKVAFPDGYVLPDGRHATDLNRRLIEISNKTHDALKPLANAGKKRRIDKQILDGYLTEVGAEEAANHEWARKRYLEKEYPAVGLGRVYPGQDDGEGKYHADKRVDHNRTVQALAEFWEYSHELLNGAAETSLNLYFNPRLEIDRTIAAGVRIMRRRPLHDWVTRCPILHLDATMSKPIVKLLLPQAQFREINVTFPPVEVVFIKQVTDRINGKSSYTEQEGARDNAGRANRLKQIRDEVNLIASFYRRAKVAVICPDGLEKELRKTVPKNAILAHYGHLRGRNDLEDVDIFVLIGRDEPSPETMEAKGRLLSGQEVTELSEPPPGKTGYYPTVTKYLRMRDGTTVAVENHYHPDERVEGYRWLSTEAELLQAVYRARPLNRTPWKPLKVYVLTSVCLPLPVDRAVTWKEEAPSLFQRMLQAKTRATDSPSHAFKMFPKWWPSVNAAKKALQDYPYRAPRLIRKFLSFVPAEWQDGDTRLHVRMRGPNPVYRDTQGLDPSYPQNPASIRKKALYGAILDDPPVLRPVRLVEAALFEEEWPGVRTIQYREVGSRANRPATGYYLPESNPDPLAAFAADLECELELYPKQGESK